jgi:hypothetical protein
LNKELIKTNLNKPAFSMGVLGELAKPKEPEEVPAIPVGLIQVEPSVDAESGEPVTKKRKAVNAIV